MRTKKLPLSRASICMCVVLAFGLVGVLVSGCKCTKEEKYPGVWVACIDGIPTLMRYDEDTPVPVVHKDPRFDPNKWNCPDKGSPEPTDSSQSVFKPSSPSGPKGTNRKYATSSNTPSVFLPRQLLVSPLVPPIPPPSTPPACDPSYPDVITTVHSQAVLTRISTCPFQIKVAIPVVTRPLQVQITPDGTTALVTSFDNAVNFIDLASNKVTYTLMTDSSINPNGLAISPDGTKAYITSFNTGNPAVAVIDLNTRQVTATIPVDTYPQGAYLTPDGSQLWVTFPFGASVYVIDTLTNTISILIPIPQTTGIAFDSAGTTAYITSTSAASGQVVAVDTASFQVIKTYAVGLGPTDIKMSYGDQFLIVNNNAENTVSVIDFITGQVNTATVGAAPKGIAFVR